MGNKLKEIEVELTRSQQRGLIRTAIKFIRKLRGLKGSLIFNEELLKYTRHYPTDRAKLLNIGCNVIVNDFIGENNE